MKKALIAVIAMVVLVHIVLFVPRVLRGKDSIHATVPEEEAAPVVPAERRAVTREVLKPPESVQQLLKYYSQSLDRLDSLRIKIETSEEKDLSYSGEYEFFPSNLSGQYSCRRSVDYRCDGRRYSVREWGQGDVRGASTTLPPGKKCYTSCFWDGMRAGSYLQGWEPSHRDRLSLKSECVSPNSVAMRSMPWVGGPLLGYTPAMYLRMDEFLRRSGVASMHREPEDASGAALYRIEADTKFGGYTVWLDPEHDYHMVKCRIERGEGDVWFAPDWRVDPGMSWTVVFGGVHFKSVDGIWVPVEGNIENRHEITNGDYGVTRHHILFTDVVLSPDHDALGSFVLDDIRDGTWVLDENSREFSWQGGKLIPEKKR